MTLNALIVIVIAIIAAWTGNRIIDLVVPRLTRFMAKWSERAASERVSRMRRLETFAGIGTAIVRAIWFGNCVYWAWRMLTPTTAPIALLGASAVAAIVAASVVGPILRDITLGSMMIAEGWYNVGDHIIVEPFMNVSGVVEKLTPRSTKLRSLTGEAIWLHNQHIQGARVTSRGVRTIALDVFVNDPEAGQRAVRKAIRTVPTGPTMLAGKLEISETEQLGDELWRISTVGQTTPGREWLIEDFAIKAITKYDAQGKSGPSIVAGPIAHYADAMAERRFGRTVQARAKS